MMRFRTPRRGVVRVLSTAVLASALAVAATGLTAATAQAQPVLSGSLSFSGDDWIGGGQSYAYSTGAQDALNVSAGSDDNVVSVSVDGTQGDWWYLDLAAPAGQALQPGTYQATRYPFNDTGAGLSLSGDGRGCNTLTGSFTVFDVAFGPYGYVQTLDASFEQHCEGGSAATQGEVHISNPAPPEHLDLGLAVAVNGTADTLNGNATIHGTVTCNEAVPVAVSGTVTQVSKRILVRAPFSTSVACEPGAAVPWTAQAVPQGTTPFLKGRAEVAAQASAPDPNYPAVATVARTVPVALAKR